jgi:hypothetical protein
MKTIVPTFLPFLAVVAVSAPEAPAPEQSRTRSDGTVIGTWSEPVNGPPTVARVNHASHAMEITLRVSHFGRMPHTHSNPEADNQYLTCSWNRNKSPRNCS